MENLSYYYSIPYVFGLIFLLFFSFFEVKTNAINRSYIRILSICFFIWFFALRGFVGSDFTSYYLFFESLPDISKFTFDEPLKYPFEPGFVVFSSLIKFFSDNFHFFVFVNTIFDTILLVVVLKRYCNEYFVFALAVFFVFGGELEINLLRNIKSILLFLISLKYLNERKFAPYFLMNMFGLTFHATAVFFIPLYFILHKISKRFFLYVFITGCVVYFLQIKYIAFIASLIGQMLGGVYLLKTSGYIESAESSGIKLSFIYICVPFILIYKNYDKIISRNSSNIIFVNMFLLYCIANLFFTEILVFRSRFGALFVLSLCVIFSQILICFQNVRIKFYSVVFTFLILLFSKIILLNTPLPNVYDNLTFGIMSYEKRISNFNQFSPESIY